MKDPNFEIPVGNGAYSGSSRARKAASSARGPSSQAVVSDRPPATQSDSGIRSGDQNLKQDSQPKVLNGNTKPAAGATPPNQVNPEGRPGQNARKTNAQGAGSR